MVAVGLGVSRLGWFILDPKTRFEPVLEVSREQGSSTSGNYSGISSKVRTNN